MNLNRQRVGVLMGGWTGEREVSLHSGENVLDALLGQQYDAQRLDMVGPDELLPALNAVDVVFNCLHGGVGEDGTLQALLDFNDIPYTGSGMLACGLAMDKLRAKRLFQQAGLTVADQAVGWDPNEADFDAWCAQTLSVLGLPVVVKPVHEGSSLGVEIVRKADDFQRACSQVGQAFGAYFVEKYVAGKEITAGVLRVAQKDVVLPLLELRPRRAFYDYEAKYTPGMTEFIVPAQLDEAAAAQVRTAALRAHEALGCFGYSRVDFRVSEAGIPYALEVNTSPGMTVTSDLPQVAQAAGIDFVQLVETMLQSAIQRRLTYALSPRSNTLSPTLVIPRPVSFGV